MINWPKRREWGWYATLIRTPWFCLKVLKFNPAGSLSYQRHSHRTELWLFLRGYGRIEHETRTMHLRWDSDPFEIWCINPGDWHRFMAYSKPVYAIEFQYGKKVTEIDIERKQI